jgi:hypothetical protein
VQDKLVYAWWYAQGSELNGMGAAQPISETDYHWHRVWFTSTDVSRGHAHTPGEVRAKVVYDYYQDGGDPSELRLNFHFHSVSPFWSRDDLDDIQKRVECAGGAKVLHVVMAGSKVIGRIDWGDLAEKQAFYMDVEMEGGYAELEQRIAKVLEDSRAARAVAIARSPSRWEFHRSGRPGAQPAGRGAGGMWPRWELDSTGSNGPWRGDDFEMCPECGDCDSCGYTECYQQACPVGP